MDLGMVWTFIQGVLPVSWLPIVSMVLMVLGALVVMASAYVKITPSLDDDAWWAKLEAVPVLGALLKFLVGLSPIKRKEE